MAAQPEITDLETPSTFPKKLFELLQYQEDKYPQEVCLSYKVEGEWKSFSTKEVITIVDKLSMGLQEKGLEKNDNTGIVSWNRPEWNFVDIALLQIGAVSVPMYPNITIDDYSYILAHSNIKLIFASDPIVIGKLLHAIERSKLEIELYTFDKTENCSYWEDLLVEENPERRKRLEQSKLSSDPDDVFTIIYTSGTTGTPKGVMLNQLNVMSNAQGVHQCFPIIGKDARVLSFLPLCHIFARTNFFFDLSQGVSIYYAESMDTISENIREVGPIYFSTVPRLLEKLYDKILQKGYELKGPKRWIFFWALRLAKRYNPAGGHNNIYYRKLSFARKVVFTKWQEALGGNLELIVTGASAVQPRLVKIFWAAGIKVCEGYGLTETSPGVAIMRPFAERVRPGYVGELVPEVEVKIADDGEILVKGPNVMQGYYKTPEKTKEVMTDDGWFMTGDIGQLDDGYLKITDRKKELLKTSGGKYVAPQPIENSFKESILVDQVIVVGDGKKFASALIIPNFESLKDWCQIKEIKYTSENKIIKDPKVLEKFDRIREIANQSFPNFEQIKRLTLLTRPWTTESGELTATLKLKRKIITEEYQKVIESMYND